MPIYVYETIPQKPRQRPIRFEIKQSIKDAALKVHPETGVPVRRVITGGVGVITSSRGGTRRKSSGGGCCGGRGGCGGGCSCGCHH